MSSLSDFLRGKPAPTSASEFTTDNPLVVSLLAEFLDTDNDNASVEAWVKWGAKKLGDFARGSSKTAPEFKLELSKAWPFDPKTLPTYSHIFIYFALIQFYFSSDVATLQKVHALIPEQVFTEEKRASPLGVGHTAVAESVSSPPPTGSGLSGTSLSALSSLAATSPFHTVPANSPFNYSFSVPPAAATSRLSGLHGFPSPVDVPPPKTELFPSNFLSRASTASTLSLTRRDDWRKHGILGVSLTNPQTISRVLELMTDEVRQNVLSEQGKLAIQAMTDSIVSLYQTLAPMLATDPAGAPMAGALLDAVFTPIQKYAEAVTFYSKTVNADSRYSPELMSDYYSVLSSYHGDLVPLDLNHTRKAALKVTARRPKNSKHSFFRPTSPWHKPPDRRPSRDRSSPSPSRTNSKSPDRERSRSPRRT